MRKIAQALRAVQPVLPLLCRRRPAGIYYQTNWGPTGSLLKPNTRVLEAFQNLHELTTLVAEHPVQTKRLDDIEGLGDVDFLKLDVQGAELTVLQGAERVLKDVSVVQVEVEFVELYENQPLFADVDRFLRGQGFTFHTFMGFGSRCFKPMLANNDPNRGMKQLLWSDAVYVRDWLHARGAIRGQDRQVRHARSRHRRLAGPVPGPARAPGLAHGNGTWEALYGDAGGAAALNCGDPPTAPPFAPQGERSSCAIPRARRNRRSGWR